MFRAGRAGRRISGAVIGDERDKVWRCIIAFLVCVAVFMY